MHSSRLCQSPTVSAELIETCEDLSTDNPITRNLYSFQTKDRKRLQEPEQLQRSLQVRDTVYAALQLDLARQTCTKLNSFFIRTLRDCGFIQLVPETVDSSRLFPETVDSSRLFPETVDSSRLFPETVDSSSLFPETVGSSRLFQRLESSSFQSLGTVSAELIDIYEDLLIHNPNQRGTRPFLASFIFNV